MVAYKVKLIGKAQINFFLHNNVPLNDSDLNNYDELMIKLKRDVF